MNKNDIFSHLLSSNINTKQIHYIVQQIHYIVQHRNMADTYRTVWGFFLLQNEIMWQMYFQQEVDRASFSYINHL